MNPVFSLRKLLSFGFAEGLGRGFNWLLLLILPVLLDNDAEYGYIGLILAFEAVLANVLILGQDRSTLRLARTERELVHSFSAAVQLTSLAALLLLVLTLLYRGLIGAAAFSIPILPHLVTLAAALWLLNVNLICGNVARVQDDVALYYRLRVFFFILKFLFIAALALLLKSSYAYCLGLLLALLAAMLLCAPRCAKYYSREIPAGVRAALLIFGLPFIFQIIGGNVIVYFSRFFLEVFSSINDVALYTFAFAYGSGATLIYSIIAIYLEPLIYRHSGQPALQEKLLACYTSFCVAAAALLYAATYLPLLELIARYRPSLTGTALVLPIIISTFLMRPISQQASLRLIARLHTARIGALAVLAAVINLILNFLWIPPYGLKGAAFAFYVAMLIYSIAIFAVSFPKAGVKIPDLIFAAAVFSISLSLLPVGDPRLYSGLLLLIGLACGALFWKQYREIAREKSPAQTIE